MSKSHHLLPGRSRITQTQEAPQYPFMGRKIASFCYIVAYFLTWIYITLPFVGDEIAVLIILLLIPGSIFFTASIILLWPLVSQKAYINELNEYYELQYQQKLCQENVKKFQKWIAEKVQQFQKLAEERYQQQLYTKYDLMIAKKQIQHLLELSEYLNRYKKYMPLQDYWRFNNLIATIELPPVN